MFGEHLGQPSDQPAGRLVARATHHLGVVRDLFAGQRAPHALLVVELHIEQCGRQVVGGIPGAMMSKPPDPISGSRQSMQYCRIWSSMAAIRRGVKTRDISTRSLVCAGGSSNIITPLGMSKSVLISSRMSLLLLENVCQFDSAASTSG